MAHLTILMPAFNAAPYIREAVDSLLQQTFQDFELWIIDDGSTDSTPKIIRSFSDARIKKFYFDQNRGRVLLINEFVKKVSSEFFTVTDADDASHPQRLQMQLNLFSKDPELMMCGTSYWAMDDKGYLFRELRLPIEHKEVYNQMPSRCQFLGATTIMRSSLITCFPDFYRGYFKDNIADSDLASRIVDRFKAVNVGQPLYYYRMVRNSLTRKNVTIRSLILYHAIAFLSAERRSLGEDSLMKNEPETVDTFLGELSKPYVADSSFIYRHTAFTHLYWKVMDEAWQNGFLAWRTNPWHGKNYFLLVYLAAKTAHYFLEDRFRSIHYKTHFGKPLLLIHEY
jgi:glycosyltransferase involved in cell wall biosynthesis